MRDTLPRAQGRLARRHAGLELLMPQRALECGYAALLDDRGRAIRDPDALYIQTYTEMRLAQGMADTEIIRVQSRPEL